ncbi:hypothetical protein UPYG_G00107630 [Umbra pygmaea]|uniref:FIIND domain-containing protein n=1 Tax=Umbra pygmaea TaxID=75934 RepID=A0ABD0X374_UMBPY
MASTKFVRDTLTKWNLSKFIQNFEDEEINEEGFLLLTEKNIEQLIPKMGPRTIFTKKHKELVKKQQTLSNDDENIQVATSSLASIIKIMPSTSMEPLSPVKRRVDMDDVTNQPKKKKYCTASGSTVSLDSTKKTVKKIMQSVRSKINDRPSTKLTDFLRGKIEMLEKNRKEIVGVFGRTGAGKSYLINTILDEPNLLPSGSQGACTSVMIQVEANMTDEQYIAEIEFITVQDWRDELLPLISSCESEEDEDKKKPNVNDEDLEKIKALYGEDGYKKDIEELMAKKHFNKIPEFYSSRKKLVRCDKAEELSEKITSFTRSDTESATFKQQYWPLVKCITIKVPNSKELLEHVVLVDLPGSGDCNRSRDEMWKSFVGKCSSVWIVSDIARATSEKETWDILESTVSLFGPGGECRSIKFICTKTDAIENNQNDDAHARILNRNEFTKKKVVVKFNKQKEIKKHFSCGEDFFQVFTVSSAEYRNGRNLGEEETEIPHLQEFLRNLNDHHTRTSDYLTGVYGILSLIQGAKKSHMTNSKEELCKVLEKRLKNELQTLDQFMEKAYMEFEEQLSEGVKKSDETWEELINKVIKPRKTTGSAFHSVLKSLCKNDGIHKPKNKNKREKNSNELLASTMRLCTDKVFTRFFPNDKCGPIRAQIEKFTLATNSLVGEHQSMSLHLIFLRTEERNLKSKLICDLLERKKQIYCSLSKSIKDSMHASYERAAAHKGKGSLNRMKVELHQHVQNGNIFQKAKDDMLDSLTKLKEHILKQLKFELQKSIEISFKTPDYAFLPDITEDYIKIKKLMSEFSSVPVTPTLDSTSKSSAFQTQSVQIDSSLYTHYIRKFNYRQQCPQAGLFQCGLTGLMFKMTGMGEVIYKMKQWDMDLLGSMTPAGPLFSINCPVVQQLHLPHCMCDVDDDTLSVAHIKNDTLEIVKPVKTTSTHVVVDITHNSLVGLIRHGVSLLPVKGQVLLFLQPQGDATQKATLNVFLLPKNVPIHEVKHQQKGSILIETSSECTLTPTGEYSLSYQLVTTNPVYLKSQQFDVDYMAIVQPTFQVYLDHISDAQNMSLSLFDTESNVEKVWGCVVQTDL